MNSTIFYLNDEKTDIVAVKWEDDWKNMVVYHNKDKIGEIPTKDDLKIGKPLLSSDGKILFIQLKSSVFEKPYLELLVNGDPYDYREPSTEDKIHKTFIIILLIAGINFFLGLISILSDIAYIDKLGFGYHSIIFGFIFLGLGLAFRYKKSLIAVIIMSGILLLDLIIQIKIAISLNFENIKFDGIIARIVLIVLFIQGGYYIILQRRENKNNAR